MWKHYCVLCFYLFSWVQLAQTIWLGAKWCYCIWYRLKTSLIHFYLWYLVLMKLIHLFLSLLHTFPLPCHVLPLTWPLPSWFPYSPLYKAAGDSCLLALSSTPTLQQTARLLSALMPSMPCSSVSKLLPGCLPCHGVSSRSCFCGWLLSFCFALSAHSLVWFLC